MLFRLYRVLRSVHRAYALSVFFLYLGLFVLAFSLIFLFPPGALVMVFVGLGGLAVAVTVGLLLRTSVHGLARSLLRRGVCPGCADRSPVPSWPREAVTEVEDIASPWRCELCGIGYGSSGAEEETGTPAAPPAGPGPLLV